jgi:hypothetical protein
VNWIACGCRLCHFPVYLCDSKGSSSEATGDAPLRGNGRDQERYIKLRHPGDHVGTSFLHWLERRELFSARAHTHKTHSLLLKLVFRTLRLSKKVRRMYLDSLKFVHASLWLLYFVFWEQCEGYRVTVRDILEEPTASITDIENQVFFWGGWMVWEKWGTWPHGRTGCNQ